MEFNNLDELFNEWEELDKNEAIKNKKTFCRDGIIDEEEFQKNSVKVLFISNEANEGTKAIKEDQYKDIKEGDIKTGDRRKDFKQYYKNNSNEWGGRILERTCALYEVIDNYDKIKNKNLKIEKSDVHLVARRFAFMNLKKVGGEENINKDTISDYCIKRKDFINNEIQIINPDIIIWLGINTFDINLKKKWINVKKEKNRNYYLYINDKKIPVLRMWHTSYYRAKNEPLSCFEDKILGKLAHKLVDLIDENEDVKKMLKE